MGLQSKTITANGSNGHHKFTLNVIEESTSVDNNDSPMSFSFVLSPIQAGWDFYWGSGITYTITINSESYSGNITAYDGSSTLTIRTGTLTIPHNDDGSKTINISFSVTDSTGQTYAPGNASASDKMELTTIPRASDIAVPNTDLGQNIPITIGKKVDSFTSTLSYVIGSLTGTIVEKTSLASYPWVMSSTLINQIKRTYSNTGSYAKGGIEAKVICNTYNGSTLIGTKETKFKLYITDKPTIDNVVRTELNDKISALTTSVLRHASQNKFTITASASIGTTIAGYRVKNGSQDSGILTSNEVNLNDIQNYYEENGSLKTKFIVTVIDARGNESDEYPIVCDFINYINVFINKTDVVLKRTNKTANDCILYLTGNFFNGKIGITDNIITFKYRYKLQGTTEYSEWKTLTAIYDNNTFKIDNLTIPGVFDFKENYDFELVASDLIDNSDEYKKIFINSDSFVKWYKNGGWIKELNVDKFKINGTEFNDYFNPSFCKMVTNFGSKTITSVDTKITGFTNKISYGDYVADTSNNQLIIKNTELCQITGNACGSGYASIKIRITESTSNKVITNIKLLIQTGGNNYWSIPLPTEIIKLDPTKTYYINLFASSYNGSTFNMNDGFSSSDTWISAKKIK